MCEKFLIEILGTMYLHNMTSQHLSPFSQCIFLLQHPSTLSALDSGLPDPCE